MKFKRFLVYFTFASSFLFLIFPIALELYVNINRIATIYRYNKKVETLTDSEKDSVRYLVKNAKNSEVLTNFLNNTGGVFGYLDIARHGVYLPIYFENYIDGNIFKFEKSGFFSAFDGRNFILKTKGHYFFENLFSRISDIKNEDDVILHILGEKVSFKVKDAKLVFNFDEFAFSNVNDDFLFILLDCPFISSSYKFLIKTEKVCTDIDQNCGIFIMFFKNNYILILSIFMVFAIILTFLIFFRYVYSLTKNKRFKVKYKY